MYRDDLPLSSTDYWASYWRPAPPDPFSYRLPKWKRIKERWGYRLVRDGLSGHIDSAAYLRACDEYQQRVKELESKAAGRRAGDKPWYMAGSDYDRRQRS